MFGQVWRGGPQAELSRLLEVCRIERLDETRARVAGEACVRAGTADLIDATVAVGAIACGDLVVTGDRNDITRLANALQVVLEIAAV